MLFFGEKIIYFRTVSLSLFTFCEVTIRTTSWHPDDLDVRPVQVPGDHFKSTVESFNHVNINIRAKQFEITISSIDVAYVVGLFEMCFVLSCSINKPDSLKWIDFPA